MKLSRLLESAFSVEIPPEKDAEITLVTDNSKECIPGALFVAIKGAAADGADFSDEAYGRGARVFVLSKKKKLPKDSIVIYSKNPRKTLAELCSAFYCHPEKKLTVVGITGTKGKSTTAYLLSKILFGMGVENVVLGTLGVTGLRHFEIKNTTPSPTVIFKVLSSAVKGGAKVAIIEVSSQALKEFRVHGITFEYAAFTGLSRDHIGGSEHPSFSDYVHSKRMLFSSYGVRVAVVNSDDAYSSYMSAGVGRVVKCGFSPSADIVINRFSDSPFGSSFFVGDVRVDSALPGEYNAENITLALALAREISGSSIVEASTYVRGVKIDGRFELLMLDGVSVVIDYAHNFQSFKEVATLSKRLFRGKIICVFGSVGERSYERRRELAEAAEKYADFSVITSDNSGLELPLSICADIYASFSDKTKAKIIVGRADAISYALGEAKRGDAVLILGKGHEKFLNQGGKRIAFSDSDFVRTIKK